MARFLILIVLLTALGCHGHNRTSQSICAPGEAKVTAELGQMMRDSADAWTADTALVFARFHNMMKEDESYATGLTTLPCNKDRRPMGARAQREHQRPAV